MYGERFRDAVRKNNPDVEWVQYDGEQHGWQILADNVDFWTRVDEFLELNLFAVLPK
jgi:acetyl esterase/lipase